MTCKFCGGPMNDLTHGQGKGRNWICLNRNKVNYTLDRPIGLCEAHLYQKMISFFLDQYEPEAKWFTKMEWEAYVEDFSNQSA